MFARPDLSKLDTLFWNDNDSKGFTIVHQDSKRVLVGRS